MKKLLVILLFTSKFCWGQITISVGGGSQFCSGGPWASVIYDQAYTANTLYIVSFVLTGQYNLPVITQDSVNWEFLAQVGSTTSTILLYRCMPAYNVTAEHNVFSWFPSSTGFVTVVVNNGFKLPAPTNETQLSASGF